MKTYLFILTATLLLACRKDKASSTDAPAQPGKFQDFIGRYMVYDSVVTLDPGVTYLELPGRGKGSDQRIRQDGIIEVYTSLTAPVMMNYEFKAPDTLFVSDPVSSPSRSSYSNISMLRKNHFIMRQSFQRRKTEWHYTAE